MSLPHGLKPPRAVLFDWDNTLVNTWPTIVECYHDTFTALGMTPWTATEALFAGAQRLRAEIVVTYGSYSIAGDFLAASNVAFDASLKARNPAWGIRDVNDVADLAQRNGFRLDETVHMPANNLALIFRH